MARRGQLVQIEPAALCIRGRFIGQSPSKMSGALEIDLGSQLYSASVHPPPPHNLATKPKNLLAHGSSKLNIDLGAIVAYA